MIDRRMRRVLPALIGVVLLGLLFWWAMPRLVAALPGRVRHYVPQALVERVTTPLPAALPVPSGPAPAAQELARAAAPATPTPVPSPTNEPADDTATGAVPRPSPTPVPTSVPAPTSVPLPPYGRIDGLPIIPQKFNNCGPTNLTIVLNYYGVDVDQFDVAGVVRPNYEDRNVSPDELVQYVTEQTDLAAAAYVAGDVDILRRLVAAGFPVIIEKGLEPDAATGWMGHYLTVYGYDDVTSHVLVRDTFLGPWRGDGLASYRDTERYWAQFNGTFIVVYRPQQAAALEAVLGPDYGEAATAGGRAVELARAAVARTPDDPFAWFNLGSSLTEMAGQGQAVLYEDAAAAYDQARLLGLPARMLWYQFQPYEAYLAAGRPADVLALAEATLASQGGRNVEETYYYQGLALAMTGDEGARAAFERAAALNPQSRVGQAARAALAGE